MLARLGNVLYWAATALALLILGLAFYERFFSLDGRSEQFGFIFTVVLAGIIWLIGRACRYVFSGE